MSEEGDEECNTGLGNKPQISEMHGGVELENVEVVALGTEKSKEEDIISEMVNEFQVSRTTECAGSLDENMEINGLEKKDSNENVVGSELYEDDIKTKPKSSDVTDLDMENERELDESGKKGVIGSDSGKNAFFLRPPDPEEVESALSFLISHGSLPIEQMRDSVMQLISRRRLDAVIESDYNLAEQYDNAAQMLTRDESDTVFDREERIRHSQIDVRVEEFEIKLRETQEKYDDKLNQLELERSESIRSFKVQRREEAAEFQKKWQRPGWLAQFRRPSPGLLQMRYIEKKLALSKQYDEAKVQGRIADMMQKSEEKQIEAELERRMRDHFLKMREDQLNCLNKLNEHFDALRSELELQRSREIMSLEYAIRQTDVKKAVSVNRRLRRIPSALTRMNELEIGPGSVAKTSPRTAAKLAGFRHQTRSDLQVKAPSDRRFSRLVAAHPVLRPQSRVAKVAKIRRKQSALR
jgi:acetolactate synthase small subunit